MFLNSGRENPRASLAATYARGYPVAFDARAELLDNLALTSMMQYCIKMMPLKTIGGGGHLFRIRVEGILDVTLSDHSKMADSLNGHATQ